MNQLVKNNIEYFIQIVNGQNNLLRRVSTSNLKKYHGIGKKNCYGSD